MRVVIGAALIAALTPLRAQHYRWTDERGKVHFSDSLPPASARNVQVRPGSRLRARRANRSRYSKPAAISRSRSIPCPTAKLARRRAGSSTRAASVSRGERGHAGAVRDPERDNRPRDGAGAPRGQPGAARASTRSAYTLALDAAGYPKKGSGARLARSPPTAQGTRQRLAKAEAAQPRDPTRRGTGRRARCRTPELERILASRVARARAAA